jgi:pantothenate kinase
MREDLLPAHLDHAAQPAAPGEIGNSRGVRRARAVYVSAHVPLAVRRSRPGAWAKLGESAPLPLSAAELDGLRSLGDPVDLDEVREVYLPLTRLLALHIEESERLYGAYRTFLLPGTEPPQRTPFVIGIAGSVSVGKSTIARLLRWLLARLPHSPRWS